MFEFLPDESSSLFAMKTALSKVSSFESGKTVSGSVEIDLNAMSGWCDQSRGAHP